MKKQTKHSYRISNCFALNYQQINDDEGTLLMLTKSHKGRIKTCTAVTSIKFYHSLYLFIFYSKNWKKNVTL